MNLVNSQIISNGSNGLYVSGSATVTVQKSQISRNEQSGLFVVGLATVEVRSSTIEGNGSYGGCQQAGPRHWMMCNGVTMFASPQVTITDSKIINNTDWGIAAELRKCGYDEDEFTGQVVFQEMKLENISGNNTSGNQDGMGNPGNHPWNRPGVPDGQVCLP